MTVRELVDDILHWRRLPDVILREGEPSVRNRADALDAQITADRAEIVRLRERISELESERSWSKDISTYGG